MKIASWNVNSLRIRQLQLVRWLGEVQPDVICLQETKIADDRFPVSDLEAAGYSSVFAGQKTYNGVAILSREALSDVTVGLVGDDALAQKRLVAARAGGLTIVNVYVPNGSMVGSEKYAYKLGWLARLLETLRERHSPGEPLVLCGDFNIAPEERDVYDPDAVRGTIMFSDEERQALKGILEWGLADTFRLHTPEAGHYSWWDYRAAAFRRNMGWRIDLILATSPLVRACRSASIDVEPRRGEQPSDHAPVLAEFEG